MYLSDNDKRDIIKFLESDKPLPDKYRFMLFDDKREVELVWNGKTNEVSNVVLPFQVIEQIDEPREENEKKLQMGFDFDERGRQIQGWTNKLIWGDNKLILSSLKNGPLRQQIEENGGIKLIYIDPPFDVGADFSMDIEVGDEQFHKEASVLEELAYRDTWGKGADSFIAMIYERLSLMHDLLAEDGSIYVHCDWRVNSFIRLVLDEVFGKDNFQREIIWSIETSSGFKAQADNWIRGHDTLYFYSKSNNIIFNKQFLPLEEKTIRRYDKVDDKGNKYKVYYNGDGSERRVYLDQSKGRPLTDTWTDIIGFQTINNTGEYLNYPTQKPETVLARIINTSSGKGDLVADFFAGSGTTLAVAEKLNRKWIGSDLGKFAIHTTRKRLINLQRELKKEGKDYRAFEILNLGKYERQVYVGINTNLPNDQKQKQLKQKENDYINLILKAYRAEKVEGYKTFHGKKSARLVTIGPINLPVTRLYVEEVLVECLEKQITKVDILAFEFEMGLAPNIIDDAKSKGVDLVLKYIPREVFDKRAVEKNQVIFYDVSYLEVKPHINGKSVAIELTDFSVFYNQDTIANAESVLGNGQNRIIVENGQIIKVSKDKNGIVEKEVLTKKWSDWIDYWAVDFDYESKKEFIRIKKNDLSQLKIDGTEDPKQMKFDDYEEIWTGDYVFENEWQSFRTKKNRNLDFTSIYKECTRGRRKIAIKVVDIFGNDTMKVIEINI